MTIRRLVAGRHLQMVRRRLMMKRWHIMSTWVVITVQYNIAKNNSSAPNPSGSTTPNKPTKRQSQGLTLEYPARVSQKFPLPCSKNRWNFTHRWPHWKRQKSCQPKESYGKITNSNLIMGLRQISSKVADRFQEELYRQVKSSNRWRLGLWAGQVHRWSIWYRPR